MWTSVTDIGNKVAHNEANQILKQLMRLSRVLIIEVHPRRLPNVVLKKSKRLNYNAWKLKEFSS